MKILHQCPECDRWFDSPSVCMPSGTETVPVIFGSMMPFGESDGR